MIADALLEEVRARADIVEVIGESIPLKRAGKDFRALCPFHHEKTPSFYVVPSKGFYKCFGCGESGDVFAFIMKRTGASFIDAVRQVAAKTGVEIPADTTGPSAEEPNRALYEAIAFAADHFRQCLEVAAGDHARRYLDGRGIDAATAEKYRIGYAPEEWRGLREAAHRHGIEDAVLLAAGLIKESERSEEPYDRFRDRIIFPVADVSGRLVAFGGRALRLGESVPKYLNSPETPIYQKGRILYGLNWSRSAIRREAAALVVEGYMDYVSLAAHGIENVVAGMGTALTPEQANLVARYTAKAYLLYDSDPAGLRATFRSADALLRAGVHPLVVTLPEGDDPDSLVRRGGSPAMRPLIDDAVDVLERKLQMLEERGYFTDIDGSRRALDRLLPTIRSTIDPALRDIYVTRVAERTGVRRETLEHEVEPGTAVTTGRFRPARPATGQRPAAGSTGRANGQAPHEAEKLLLLLLVRDPSRIAEAAAAVLPEELRDPANRELFEALIGRDRAGDAAAPLSLGAIAALRLQELEREKLEVADAEQSFLDAVAEIGELPRLFRRLAELDVKLAVSPRGDEAVAIVKEKSTLLGELRTRGVSEDLGFRMSRRYRRIRRDPPAGRNEPSTDDG